MGSRIRRLRPQANVGNREFDDTVVKDVVVSVGELDQHPVVAGRQVLYDDWNAAGVRPIPCADDRVGVEICFPKFAGRRTVLRGERAQRSRVRMDRSGRQSCHSILRTEYTGLPEAGIRPAEVPQLNSLPSSRATCRCSARPTGHRILTIATLAPNANGPSFRIGNRQPLRRTLSFPSSLCGRPAQACRWR